MKIKELLDGLAYLSNEIKYETEISGVEIDSRKVKKGDVFIAIKGYRADGHKYIETALKKGAALVVCEDKEYFRGENVILVESSRYALSHISNNLYGKPSQKLKLIGITGTNGKSSIAMMLYDLFGKLGVKAGVIGTVGIMMSGEEIEYDKTTPTTPEANSLNKVYSEMVDKGVEVAIMEVTSHSIELKRVEHLDFDYGVFTNLTPDHLDFHINMENYYMAKEKLFTKAKRLIVNTDDEYGLRIHTKYNEKSLSYGIKSGDYNATGIKGSEEGTSFEITNEGISRTIRTPFHGKAYVLNALAAATVIKDMGYKEDEFYPLFNEIETVPGRLEHVSNGVFVDYAHTPDALENTLLTAREISRGKVISVFGAGGDRDRTKRPLMGNISSMKADYTIITSDNPRTEDPDTIISEIANGIEEGSDFIIVPDREEAIRIAIEMKKADDVVIIAGKGHEKYQEIMGVLHPFDDVEIAKRYLEKKYE